MRVAVLSDTHFGDPLGTLVTAQRGRCAIGPAYASLARAIGKVDYLVLLGDIVDWVKRRLLQVLASIETARYSKEFLFRPRVRERFRKYYRYSLHEIERLHREHHLDIPAPTHVVFGHTHQPIPWGAEELVDDVDGHPVSFCNTGGWVLKEDRTVNCFRATEGCPNAWVAGVWGGRHNSSLTIYRGPIY